MKTFTFIITLSILCSCFSNAQYIETTAPNTAWETQSRKYNISSSIDSFFYSYMSTYHLPGLAACIVKGNRIAWQGYYGFSNLAQNIPVTDSTIFMLGSVSKTITATALMRLCDAGYFQLDDSVNRYLPFSVRNPFHPQIPITFRMLLTHTSSIHDNWNVMPYSMGDYPMSLGTYLHEYLTPGGMYYSQSQNFQTYAPGTSWDYCNIGAALCGYLVETMSGITFDHYCKDSIFVPLQLTNTGWFLKDLDTSLVARPYTYSNGVYVDQGLYGYPDYPDGQLRTTVSSFARFLMTNINGGILDGVRILDTATVRTMRTAYVRGTLPQYVDSRWGLVWTVTSDINGNTLWGHLGVDNGVRASKFLSESDSIGLIVLTNGNYGATVWKPAISELMISAETDPTAVQHLQAGWNLLSLPIDPENHNTARNYPSALSDAFEYIGTYQPCQELCVCKGYWLKVGSESDFPLFGVNVYMDSVNVSVGWNLIGSISEPIPASSITSDPPGIATSSFWGYGETGYFESGIINPGKGYWVKVNQPGSLLLSSSTAMNTAARIKITPTAEPPPPGPYDGTNGIIENEIPKEFKLEQNYPNPFNPVTMINYQLQLNSRVVLKLYNLLGQEVATLVNEEQSAGYKTVRFDGTNLPSGVYFYRLQAGIFVSNKKLLLLK